MKTTFQPFNKSANTMILATAQRGNIIAAALALAMANMMELPSSPVDSGASHFNLQVLPRLRIIVSDWHESFVFPARDCIDEARALWLLRYNAAFPSNKLRYSVHDDFFSTFFGVNNVVASDTVKFFNQYKQEIIFLAEVAGNIINDQIEASAGEDVAPKTEVVKG